MGVDYNAFLGIGKRFRSKEEAVEFVASELGLSDEQAEKFDEYEEIGGVDVMIKCLDCYGGDDYFVGFEIGGSDADDLKDNVCAADEAWKAHFPHIQARVIHTVVFS
jgi:hypothetical protein